MLQPGRTDRCVGRYRDLEFRQLSHLDRRLQWRRLGRPGFTLRSLSRRQGQNEFVAAFPTARFRPQEAAVRDAQPLSTLGTGGFQCAHGTWVSILIVAGRASSPSGRHLPRSVNGMPQVPYCKGFFVFTPRSPGGSPHAGVRFPGGNDPLPPTGICRIENPPCDEANPRTAAPSLCRWVHSGRKSSLYNRTHSLPKAMPMSVRATRCEGTGSILFSCRVTTPIRVLIAPGFGYKLLRTAGMEIPTDGPGTMARKDQGARQ
jgi:hypothetical protein